MVAPQPKTVREQIVLCYANLSRAHVALEQGRSTYNSLDNWVWRDLSQKLLSGEKTMRTLYDDVKEQMKAPRACYYCGGTQKLGTDHLIPRIQGGPDEADNLIPSCRSCNSSKGRRDMMSWANWKGFFPTILLLRRYMKLVARYCETHDLMDVELSHVRNMELPFDIDQLPTKFPPLSKLELGLNVRPRLL